MFTSHSPLLTWKLDIFKDSHYFVLDFTFVQSKPDVYQSSLVMKPKVPFRCHAPPSLSYGPVCPLEFRFIVVEGLDWDKVSTFGKLFPCKETCTGVEEIENNASPEYRVKMPW